jgi:hypothetical protein
MRRFVVGTLVASTLACESTPPVVLSLTVAQPDVVVTQGDTDTLQITVTSEHTREQVQLSASQLPAGVSATFVPTSASDATHLLLLSAAADAAPVTTRVVVEAVRGDARDTTSIGFRVAVRGSFQIAASDTAQIIDLGTTGKSIKLAINRIDGFWQPVSLSVNLVRKSYDGTPPDNVVPALTIGPNPDSATIVFFAHRTEVPIDRDVDIIGTTPGLDPVTRRIRLVLVPPFTIWPEANALHPGMTRQLSARSYRRDVDNGVYGASSAVYHVERVAETWTTEDPAVATVSAAGVITAVGPGTTIVHARLNGFERIAAVTVIPSPGTLRFALVWGRARYPFNGDDSGEFFTNPHGLTPLDRGCGVTTDQRLFCWGMPYAFQPDGYLDGYFDRCETVRFVRLFDYELARSRCGEIPRELFPSARFNSLAPLSPWVAGACAITTANQVNCWGENKNGELGIGTTDTLSHGLTGIASSDRFVQVNSYGNSRCALREDGAVYCWGGSRSFAVVTPTRLGGTTTFRQLSESGDCALAADSTAYCWTLSYGGTAQAPVGPTPKQISMDRYVDLTEVSAGYCGLTPSGQAKCWTVDYATGTSGTPTIPANAPTFAALENGWGITADGDRYSFAAGPWRSTAGTRTGFPASFKFRTLSDSCGIGIDGFAYCWNATFHKLRGQD